MASKYEFFHNNQLIETHQQISKPYLKDHAKSNVTYL